ncbi:photosystem II 10 kDa polypeptide, chloroplastic-like isoform X2 [Papaver somniferum]|uniref:photosystem II 10 kDa polypeptide, chloroplastic-like isoform X2 n=1 Tax=Papaver somniferum TaxID=3469 RepID=UPI000E7017CC|nr:photosystem II 10 kDa polypeptide, chloroplastic-like isoform X2 [Papaver somniferum]
MADSIQGLPSVAREQGLLMLSSEIVGTGGGMNLKRGADASGRKPAAKGVYPTGKIGANVNGYRLVGHNYRTKLDVGYIDSYIVVDVACFAMVEEDFASHRMQMISSRVPSTVHSFRQS